MIKLQEVNFCFVDGPNNLAVLDDLSIHIKPREFVSVIGPSGCGKTTLLKLIGNLYDNQRNTHLTGNIIINHKPPQESRKKHEIGFAFQKPTLLPWRKVIDNIALPKEIIKTEHRKFWEAEELLAMVGLCDFKHSYPHELSGGMQQRVAIARALSYQPPVLLMDEPFGALDACTREGLNLELLRIWKLTGATILFVTHSISEAVFLSDRVLVLSDRPARVQKEVKIDIERPRNIDLKETVDFIKYSKQLREELEKANTSSL